MPNKERENKYNHGPIRRQEENTFGSGDETRSRKSGDDADF